MSKNWYESLFPRTKLQSFKSPTLLEHDVWKPNIFYFFQNTDYNYKFSHLCTHVENDNKEFWHFYKKFIMKSPKKINLSNQSIRQINKIHFENSVKAYCLRAQYCFNCITFNDKWNYNIKTISIRDSHFNKLIISRLGFRLPQRSHLQTLKSFVNEKSGKRCEQIGETLWKIGQLGIFEEVHFFLYPRLIHVVL